MRQRDIAHIYLSPHLDDAVLSCGGRIWHQSRSCQCVRVVTVFGSPPPPSAPLSSFAESLHARWECADSTVIRRQAENRAALALIGAAGESWPYTDCIYRRLPSGDFAYASEEALFGPIHPSEEQLIAELASRIASLDSNSAIYAPLAVGRHVDHQLVQLAASIANRPIIYYEDYPYAEDPQALQAASLDKRWQSMLAPLSEHALRAKITAIACYRSQITTFWTDADEMAAAVRAFAMRTGGGSPAERYWS